MKIEKVFFSAWFLSLCNLFLWKKKKSFLNIILIGERGLDPFISVMLWADTYVDSLILQNGFNAEKKNIATHFI